MFSACSFNASKPAPMFKVSGTLNYQKQITLPENSRVIVIWQVTADDPDYGHVYGEGKIYSENNTFEIEFDSPPPSEALNWSGSSALGVGFVIITTDQSIETGKLTSDAFSTDVILGASGQYALIYVNGKFELMEERYWFTDYIQGYSVGKGVDIPDSVFDGFEPVDPTAMEIIIDDFEDIEFPNWT